MKSNFEQHLKTSLESYEAGYDPAGWTDMNSRLDKLNAGKSVSKTGKVLLIAASVIAVSGLAYYFGASSGEVAVPEKTVVQNHMPAADAADNSTAANENNASTSTDPGQIAGTTSAGLTAAAPDQKDNKSSVPEKKEMQPAPVTPDDKSNVPQEPAATQSGNAAAANEVLNASFRTDVAKVCEGGSVQFTADAAGASCTYKWFFGDGEASAEQNPKHVFKQAGNYSVKLKVTSLKDKKSAEQKSNIIVVASPEVDFTVKTSDEDKLTMLFDAEAEKGADLKWDFGDKKTGSGQNPEHAYAKYGSFQAILTAKNSSGCISTIKKEVKVENKLYAPNAFSPNGDGRNDTWFPTFDDDCTFTLTIFDGTNNVVYTTTDLNAPWEGMNPRTNAAVREGELFTWKAVVKDKKGIESTHAGKIQIVK